MDSVQELIDACTYDWSTSTSTTLDEYGGRRDLCRSVRRRIIIPYRDRREQAEELGIPIPSLLLYGPPGTGKTYLAEAIAGELPYPSAFLSGGNILSEIVNETPSQISTLFDEADALAADAGGVVLFIDEIDSVLRARSSVNQHNEDRKAVNEFLNHLEGAGERGILFIGATNEYDQIDPAALSRFDETIRIGKPDAQTRKEMFAVQLRERPHTISESEIETLASGTEGFTARDIKKVVTNAARDTLIDDESSTISYEFLRRSVIEYGASSEDG